MKQVPSTPQWRKSTYSGGDSGDCVELADLGTALGIRDSKTPEAGCVALSRPGFTALVAQIKSGELDL